MQNHVALRIRNSFLLDASTYISVAIMALLGISRLSTLTLQMIALILCLVFVLLYRFLFRTGYYEQNPALYFGSQAVVLVMLLLLRPDGNDAFNFLFYILTVHAAVVLTTRMAIIWTGIYFAIAGAVILISRGSDGLFAVFFYLAVFAVSAILGHTVQQTELTSERNRQLVAELQATQRQLQELAVVEERNRLARELHDSVKQQVFAISMQLSAARASLKDTDRAYESVVQAEKLAQQAGTELTTIIGELRPPSLESKSLVPALKEYVTEWSKQSGIEAELDIKEDPSVDTSIERILFRVAQEALANVARHSRASKARIMLATKNSDVTLTVEDNGIGFDSDSIARGVGMDSMNERVAAIGGELTVSSQKATGTKVVARVRRS